ncbi:hypothetical protein [Pseudomonas fluorescens]|uniref:hypothetical protein n=1 Tax=Pseudomonas fluorescens TaxID=294 RepID=UPI0012419538|nr:hypothetical protein [Pseudomonas fluorescens]
MKKTTAVGLMLFAAQSFALDTRPSAATIQTRLVPDIASAEMNSTVPPGWCTNIPLSYWDAKASGLKCN